MKKLLFAGMLLLGMVWHAQAQKIGHLNSQNILSGLQSVKEAESNLEAFQTQLQKKGQAMVEALQKRYQDVGRKEQQGELSPKQLDEESKKLKEEEAKIQQFEQEMQQQLLAKREELLQPILDKVNEAIASVSREQGFVYILDVGTGVLLFADEQYDITAQVKQKLGI